MKILYCFPLYKNFFYNRFTKVRIQYYIIIYKQNLDILNQNAINNIKNMISLTKCTIQIINLINNQNINYENKKINENISKKFLQKKEKFKFFLHLIMIIK